MIDFTKKEKDNLGQQKRIDLNNILVILGETFTDYYYSNGGIDVNSPPEIIYKTLEQIEMEYKKLKYLLDRKFNDDEIDDKQYKIAKTSLIYL